MALSLGIASIGNAQPISDNLAAEFKTRGDKAMASGDYSEAVEAYRKGNKIQHHSVFDYNLARALQGLGRYADALEAMERFEREASPELKNQVEDLSAVIRELRSNVGTLVLEGDLHAARVRGNKRELGDYVPGRQIRCDVGPLNLEVVATGFAPIQRDVTIEPGKTVLVELKFERNDDRGTLTISTSATGARIAVDGQIVGQAPLETRLSPGLHRLRIEHADYDPLETNLVVSARERRNVSYNLHRRPGILSQWWLWSGVAAIVAGAVVAGIALSTSKSASPGDIQPGIISAPLVAPR